MIIEPNGPKQLSFHFNNSPYVCVFFVCKIYRRQMIFCILIRKTHAKNKFVKGCSTKDSGLIKSLFIFQKFWTRSDVHIHCHYIILIILLEYVLSRIWPNYPCVLCLINY